MSGSNPEASRILSEEDMVRLGRADLRSFSRWPLGYEGKYELWKWQAAAQDRVQGAYKRKLVSTTESTHLCLLAPSEHGKSYAMVIPFVLWALGRNRNLRVGIVGSKDNLAEKFGFGIDRLFKTRSVELEKFGLVPGYPWNAQVKYLVRDDDRNLDPSISFIGPETEIQGVRFDILIFTDVATFKNQRSELTRTNIEDWIMNTMMPRLEPWGFALAEGHHVHEDDLYTKFEDLPEDWSVVKYHAIINEPCEENNYKAELLAPERWTYAELSKIRHRRPITFQLIFQNIAVAKVGITSRENLEKALDRSRPLIYSPLQGMELAFQSLHLTFDLAFSKQRWSKYSVMLAIGIDEQGVQHLLGGWRARLLPLQLRAKMVVEILKWRPTKVHIEANAAQIYVVHDVKEKLGDFAKVVNPVYTVEDKPEDADAFGIGELVELFTSQHALVPYGNRDAQELVDQLFVEIINYPSRYTDVAMAWAIMLRGLRGVKKQERKCIPFAGLTRSVSMMRLPGKLR